MMGVGGGLYALLPQGQGRQIAKLQRRRSPQNCSSAPTPAPLETEAGSCPFRLPRITNSTRRHLEDAVIYGPFQRTGYRCAGEGNPRMVREDASVPQSPTHKLQTTTSDPKGSIDVSLFCKLWPFCAQGKFERSVAFTPR